MIQSVRFPRDSFNITKAQEWLKEHNMQPIKHVDVTVNWYRYRIHPPSMFKSFRIVRLSNGVQIVIGYKI